MDKGHLGAALAGAGGVVDQFGAGGGQRRHGRFDVVHLQGNMVNARTFFVDKLDHESTNIERFTTAVFDLYNPRELPVNGILIRNFDFWITYFCLWRLLASEQFSCPFLQLIANDTPESLNF